MTTGFDEYRDRYQHIAMARRDGILELRVHTAGRSLRWGPEPRDELRRAFRDISEDRDNRVVIFTGTGEEFSGPMCTPEDGPLDYTPTPGDWDGFFWSGRQFQMNLLNIDVPMIAAINGPVYRHMELPLLCDIVLASTTTVFVDSAHFEHGNVVPGDGLNVVTTMLMGANRARYFHLTGQEILASEARDLGLVNEVLEPADLLPRAWALAERLATKPILQLRYTRAILVEGIKRQMQDLLGYGLALEGLCLTEPRDAGRAGGTSS